MDRRRVLIVATSHDRMGAGPEGGTGGGEATGVWLEELATPYYLLRDGGAAVTLASLRGGVIPVDPRSLPAGGSGGEAPDGDTGDAAGEGAAAESVTRFLDDPQALEAARNTPALADLAGEPFDALLLPGGHGTMWDLPEDDTLALLVGSYLDDGRVVAALCHGPAGLLRARRGDGRPTVEGRQVTGFSNSEETAVGLDSVVPFLLEDRLRALGADYRRGGDWESFVVRDGTLITGQNPQSSAALARAMLTALGLPGDAAAADEERLRERAYAIWEQEGRPHGRHEEHWHRAREELGHSGDTGLGRAGDALRGVDAVPSAVPSAAPSAAMEGGGGGERTLGGAGRSGTIRTPRP